MRTKESYKIVVSKKKTKHGNEYVVSDKMTGKRLFRMPDQSTCNHLMLDHSFLSGLGSVFNIPGNYYSFSDYLANNDDAKAIASDWNHVGAALWDAMSY